MSESIPPIDPELRALLREDVPASDAVRARARERLLSAVLAGSAIAASAVRTSSPGRSGLLKGGALILAFVAGAAAGAFAYGTWSKPPAAPIVYIDRPTPPVPSATPPLPVTPPTALAFPPVAVMPSSISPAVGSQVPSQMSAERRLLDEARAALTQGDPARALERLQRHRRTFPEALLGEERDAMWVQALVKAGRYDEARVRAGAFHKRTPDSLFGSVVDSAIDSIP